MDKDCCKICENLPVVDTKNEYVNQKRVEHRRWGTRYTEEEILNIKEILINNINLDKNMFHKNGISLPHGTHECISKLCEKSGRPFWGMIGKLVELGILVDCTIRNKGGSVRPNDVRLSRKFKKELESKIHETSQGNSKRHYG